MPEVYIDLLEALRLLELGHPPLPITTATLWRFLDALGVAPRLDTCTRCARPVSNTVVFVAPEGGVVCPACFTAGSEPASTSVPASPPLRSLANTLLRMPPGRVGRIQVPPDQWQAMLQICRLQIRYYLGLELNSDNYLGQLAGPEK
jgi:DNA repair protein RecO